MQHLIVEARIVVQRAVCGTVAWIRGIQHTESVAAAQLRQLHAHLLYLHRNHYAHFVDRSATGSGSTQAVDEATRTSAAASNEKLIGRSRTRCCRRACMAADSRWPPLLTGALVAAAAAARCAAV